MAAVVILPYFCPELVTNTNVDIFSLCALQKTIYQTTFLIHWNQCPLSIEFECIWLLYLFGM